MNVINRRGYGILKSKLTDYDDIIKELTVTPLIMPDYDFGNNEPIQVYRHNSTKLYVPKFYGIEKFGPAINQEKDGDDAPSLNFNGKLKEHQVDFCNRVIARINEHDSCIACSATGSGKTAMALWILSRIKKKALILVHKEFLMNQWIERIKMFLPDASVGIIKQQICETDCDITIGMIQSITMREYPKGTFDSFHITVYDECQHLSSRVFSNSLFMARSKKTLGLSATPERADGLTKVLIWALGPIIINQIVSEVEKPDVCIVVSKYSSKIDPKTNRKGLLNMPDLINQLVADPGRNKQIIDKIIELKGRKILVLTGRRDHCSVLESMMTNTKLTTGLYLGQMKEAELKQSNRADVIFATYSMASEGYDNPELDTLIMATGMGNIQQSIGRILRQKNKNKPLVVDFTDPAYFGGQAFRRRDFYRKNGYNFLGDLKIVKADKPFILVTEDCLFE
jgi:superfamily II DNA or RNA helicase